MSESIYHDLREQLDQYSIGFPATESGVEIKLLKKLFTEDEAGMYLDLTLQLETPEAVAKRSGRDADETARLLETMAEKGLIFRLKRPDSVKYGAVPFVVGSWEFQLGSLDRELALLFEEYFTEVFGKKGIAIEPPMRTIPVNKSISHSWEVAPYDDLRKILEDKERIAVANCICRVQKGLIGHECEKPLEVCFMFGAHAEYYVDNGMARWINPDEASKILDGCDEAGLVPQPFNAQNPGGFCNCCGDCCGILRSIKLSPQPAMSVRSSYYAEVDTELCSGCETCIDRCQMDAISMGDDETARIDLERCIGCGLCVTTCPSEALSLLQKSEDSLYKPPADGRELFMSLAQKRGTSLIPLKMMKG